MAKKGIIKGFFGTLINVRKWADFDEIASVARFIANSFSDVCKPKSTQADSRMDGVKTFDEMVQRLQWSEEDITKRTKYFLYQFVTYALCAVALFCYSTYLLLYGHMFLATLASFILTVLMCAYAFREHFFYMQMRQRRLRCHFKDWLNYVFKRAK